MYIFENNTKYYLYFLIWLDPPKKIIQYSIYFKIHWFIIQFTKGVIYKCTMAYMLLHLILVATCIFCDVIRNETVITCTFNWGGHFFQLLLSWVLWIKASHYLVENGWLKLSCNQKYIKEKTVWLRWISQWNSRHFDDCFLQPVNTLPFDEAVTKGVLTCPRFNFRLHIFPLSLRKLRKAVLRDFSSNFTE